MIAYKLTLEQKELLFGVEFIPNNYFNPIQDINGDWFISKEEVEQCSIDWVKKLKESEYIAPQYDGLTN